MALIVKKFGGSSVANAERVFNVANRIIEDYKKGNDVIVVVSAQGDTTDDLIEKAKEINPVNPSKREMDMLLSAGEQISIALLAMAIEKLGCPVKSLLGWQAGFETNSQYGMARIKRINFERIQKNNNQTEQKKSDIIQSQVIDYIRENYADYNLTLNNISVKFGFSPYYISKIFKQNTGETVVDFITRLRIEKAKIMLKNTDLTMSEIAEQLGMMDPSYFARRFRQHERMTPTDYRRIVRGNSI